MGVRGMYAETSKLNPELTGNPGVGRRELTCLAEGCTACFLSFVVLPTLSWAIGLLGLRQERRALLFHWALSEGPSRGAWGTEDGSGHLSQGALSMQVTDGCQRRLPGFWT